MKNVILKNFQLEDIAKNIKETWLKMTEERIRIDKAQKEVRKRWKNVNKKTYERIRRLANEIEVGRTRSDVNA